jgi:hypothetical protein
MTDSQIVNSAAIASGMLAFVIAASGRKRSRAKRLGVCAVFVGIFVAIFYERFLRIPEVEFIREYLDEWQPKSLKQFVALFFSNILLLFLGWLITALGVSRLNTWKGLDPSYPLQDDNKAKSHKLGFDESDVLGCVLSLPFALVAFVELGILIIGFWSLSLGFAGTARWLYSIINFLDAHV